MGSDLLYRMRAIFCRTRMEADLDEEIRLHVERETEAYIARGVPLDEARRRARLALGGQEQIKEACRDARGVALVETLVQDVRYAARVLRKAPGYTAAVIVTLALGIGATTGIFAVVNSLLLRPLPVRAAGRLVQLQGGFFERFVWEQIRDRPQLFERACGWTNSRFNLAERGMADWAEGLRVTGDFFETLGVRTIVGRAFTPADDRRGGGSAGPVAVISYAYWQRRFGGATDAIGRSLTVNRVAYRIVGITPRGFFGPMVGRSFDLAIPDGVADESSFLYILARLRRDQSVESASAALRAVQPQMREATLPAAIGEGYEAGDWLRQPLTVISAPNGNSPLRSRFERPLLAMQLLAGLVLLVACANVANLVLGRATARRQELSVRRALGASRLRLARQVLVESLLLSAVGAVLGLAFAAGFSRVLVRQVSLESNPTFFDVSLDWRLLLFTAAVAAGTALLFGVGPASRAARVQPFDVLKQGGRGQAGERPWGLNTVLIPAQVGLSLALVVAAGLFVRTFSSMATIDLGFDRERTLIVSLDADDARVPPAARPALYERVRQAAASVPGAAGAVTLRNTPVSSDHWFANVQVIGEVAPRLAPEQGPFLNAVSPGYFAMFGAPILAGRGFADRDRRDAPLVAVVNETFARLFVGGRNPVGETLHFGQRQSYGPAFQIVGLAKDAGSATYFGLRHGIPATVYLCIGQMNPAITYFAPPRAFRLGVRAADRVAPTLGRDLATAIGRVEPDLRVNVTTMAGCIDATLSTERLTAVLAALFGSLALLLAAVGIFGVTVYIVGRRRAEIGIRIALGATRGAVVRAVLRRTALLVAVGIVLGAAISYWASRFAAALLFGLQPRDRATFAGAALALAWVALLAGWLPARRAARIDPAIVLRNE